MSEDEWIAERSTRGVWETGMVQLYQPRLSFVATGAPATRDVVYEGLTVLPSEMPNAQSTDVDLLAPGRAAMTLRFSDETAFAGWLGAMTAATAKYSNKNACSAGLAAFFTRRWVFACCRDLFCMRNQGENPVYC